MMNDWEDELYSEEEELVGLSTIFFYFPTQDITHLKKLFKKKNSSGVKRLLLTPLPPNNPQFVL